MPLERVRQYRSFEIVPYVELEDVFVNKAVRSLQMKLRECLAEGVVGDAIPLRILLPSFHQPSGQPSAFR